MVFHVMHTWQLSHWLSVSPHCQSSESSHCVFRGLQFVCTLSLQVTNGLFHFCCNLYASFSMLGCFLSFYTSVPKAKTMSFPGLPCSSGSQVPLVTAVSVTSVIMRQKYVECKSAELSKIESSTSPEAARAISIVWSMLDIQQNNGTNLSLNET